ncbi:MAG: putative toxin-antitoxin system toxin component, PIN family [Spirochaetaceae bacterium]|jgi:putative PIN family toxin of toxin-antitoxin system|nr:putative toxin-antitoxin system toxin component, PIN family [Spirochaetaceae bacterium]
MKIVLDTNIIISAFINPKGIPGEILSLVLTKKITVCYDNNILSEYTEILKKSKFNFDTVLVDDFLNFIKESGEYIIAEPQKIKFEDKDDKAFYDVYKSSGADYIITGNKRHFPQEKHIINPREYKEIM